MVREGFSKAIYRYMRAGWGRGEAGDLCRAKAGDGLSPREKELYSNVCVWAYGRMGESGAPGDVSNVCTGAADVSIRRVYV